MSFGPVEKRRRQGSGENPWQWSPAYLDAVGQCVAAVASVLALVFVGVQLMKLQEQNKVLTKTFAQTIRPLGFFWSDVNTDAQNRPVFVARRYGADRPDRFGLAFDLVFNNGGQGILLPLSFATSFSPVPQRGYLKSVLDSTGAQETKPVGYTDWPRPIPSGAGMPYPVRFDGLEFRPEYFLQIAAIYEDIDGKCYATEYTLRLEFAKPVVAQNGQGLEAHVIKHNEQEKYSELTAAQTERLTARLARLRTVPLE